MSQGECNSLVYGSYANQFAQAAQSLPGAVAGQTRYRSGGGRDHSRAASWSDLVAGRVQAPSSSTRLRRPIRHARGVSSQTTSAARRVAARAAQVPVAAQRAPIALPSLLDQEPLYWHQPQPRRRLGYSKTAINIYIYGSATVHAPPPSIVADRSSYLPPVISPARKLSRATTRPARPSNKKVEQPVRGVL